MTIRSIRLAPDAKAVAKIAVWAAFAGLAAFGGASCGGGAGKPTVVAYVALDRIFSEPVLKAFEKESGIRVKPVFDTEASKTIGLVNRIAAERDRPLCDVFWNNEIVQTIRLAKMGLIEPYLSPQAQDIPPEFRDPKGAWTGFAARGRAIIYNKNKIAETELPRSLREWGKDAKWKGRFAVANPRFGTTSTHMAALHSLWGAEGVAELWAVWTENGVAVLAGNAVVKNEVAAGRYDFGLTDTDDAFGAIDEGAPVGIAYPTEGLLIPNSVALIRNAPHKEPGQRLIDYILRAETERLLAASGSGQIPLRASVARPPRVQAPEAVNSLKVDWDSVAGGVEDSAKLMDNLVGQENRK